MRQKQKPAYEGIVIGMMMSVIVIFCLSVSFIFSKVSRTPQISASFSGSGSGSDSTAEETQELPQEKTKEILNLQSYSSVGGNWIVKFNTTGKADLWITAVNGTEFGKDLIFLEIRCGDEILNYGWNNNSIFIENYECSETGYETSKVLTEGKHSLKFKSGSKILNNFYYVASQKND